MSDGKELKYSYRLTVSLGVVNDANGLADVFGTMDVLAVKLLFREQKFVNKTNQSSPLQGLIFMKGVTWKK